MSKKARGRNSSLVRPWTKRIFALFSESRTLAYYTIPLKSYNWQKHGPPRELKRGELSLMCCSVEAVTQHPNTSEFPFRIFSPHGELLIAATSASQRDEWIAAINELSMPSLSALDSKCHSSPPRPRARSNSSPIVVRRSNSAPDPTIPFGLSESSDDSWHSGCTSLEDSLGSSTDLSFHSNSLSSSDGDPSVRDILHCYSMDELLTRKLENSPIQRLRASTIGICTLPNRKKSFDITEPPINELDDEEASLYVSPNTSDSENEEEAITICTSMSPAAEVEEMLSPLFPEHPDAIRSSKQRARHRRPQLKQKSNDMHISGETPMELESPFAKFNGVPPDKKSWDAIFQAQLNDEDI